MVDLLPCPFCGGRPKLRTHRSGEDSMEAYVECPTCEVRTTYYEDAYAPVADAIGAWNRRVPSPQPISVGGAPKRWLVEWTMPSGSIWWQVFEHEHQARTFQSGQPELPRVTPLYDHPAPETHVTALEKEIKDLKHELASAKGRAKNATSNCEYWKAQYEALAGKDAHSSEKHLEGSDLTNEQKEILLLRIIEAMGGTTDSSEHANSWLNWFCADEIHNVQEDTFNRCEAKGWIFTTHNSDWDTSTTMLTKAGRAALDAEGKA